MIVGNWKMHKTIEESRAFVKHLTSLLTKKEVMVGLAIPFTALYAVGELVKQLGSPLEIGAQNMNEMEEGAFTGEISASMLKEVGARFVLLGHSERRHLYGESNEMVNRKLKRALEEELSPIVCVGETMEERADKKDVLKKQLYASLDGLNAKEVGRVSLAYEPVWAVGTGVAAHPDDAEEAHGYLRLLLQEKWGEDIAENCVIQYGGSVKRGNAKELLRQKNVDGLLIGGASLAADSFNEIINQGVA
ncbi:MAG: Triosephosphate isomerase [Chlamydiales bacterium]|nr:Triosephosphate isomerase [Chlamydiales bacterium]MCH9620069.1 Triosephosphate isomerase [Chlamydiales bacterium]MCH9623512.1 Triosephosphate isomerase [Chlamydiales bacterium]